jgi:NADH dehydrogenase [ubiquinone] 1 alpha subcomplex assembly factor 3
MYVLGPMAIFPHTILSWNVSQVDEISEDSLTLFSLLEPKIGKNIF